MVDVVSTGNMISPNLGSIVTFLSAAGGLGTTAMGLVDASKAFLGGASNFGFPKIRKGLARFLPSADGAKPPADGAKLPAADGAKPPFDRDKVLATLKANWMNGVAKADQKAIAKALIHLQLTKSTAPALAEAAGVDATKLSGLAKKVATGESPDPAEIAVLGQFDVVLSAVLDEAYERADQQYRNACKCVALLISVLLGMAGGRIFFGSDWSLQEVGISFLVGISATPLAPVAKDLVTALQTAVSAIQAAKT